MKALSRGQSVMVADQSDLRVKLVGAQTGIVILSYES